MPPKEDKKSSDKDEKNQEKNQQEPKENIFDLSKLAPIELDHEIQKTSTIITTDEQTKLLEGFEELPKTEWGNLKVNNFIRYLRKDGSFRRGGYFKDAWTGTFGKHNGKDCIQLSSSRSYKGTTWSICYDDIDKIWKNINKQPAKSSNIPSGTSSSTDTTTIETINKNQESIEYMNKSIEQLKIDMLKINNEQKRIINLIKKLHGIRTAK